MCYENEVIISEADWTVLMIINCLFLDCSSVSHVVSPSLSTAQLIIKIRLKPIVTKSHLSPDIQLEDVRRGGRVRVYK